MEIVVLCGGGNGRNVAFLRRCKVLDYIIFSVFNFEFSVFHALEKMLYSGTYLYVEVLSSLPVLNIMAVTWPLLQCLQSEV